MLEIQEYVKDKSLEYEPETIAIRNYLHENPEVSGEEYETVKYLKSKVQEFGLEIQNVKDSTGFVAILDTGNPGKKLGIRTDIDALPVVENENNLAGKRGCISKNVGAMHACGHDGHMSIVLTTMKILSEMKDQLNGKIYFIFEEGEEIGLGINQMLDHLSDEKLDAIYGNHLTSFMDTGEICIDAGPRMAGIARVDFSILGKSGHGSRPDLSINPVFVSAQVLNALANAWVNQVDVTKTVTLGLTQIHGGTAINVIPNDVRIGGTLRFFDVEEGRRAVEIIRKVATHTAKAHNCEIEIHELFVKSGPVINDDNLVEIAQKGIKEILPDSLVTDIQWFASESFARYAEIAPTIFAFVGIANEEYGSGAEHHNDLFDLDVAALKYGVAATTKFSVDFLTE